MGKDGHAALAHQRLPPVQVEQVAQAHAHDQDRVHDGVDVVGTQVGESEDDDIGLAFDVDQLLAVDHGRGGGVHGLDLAGVHARHGVRSLDGLEDRPAQPGRAPATDSWWWPGRWPGPGPTIPTRAAAERPSAPGKVSLLRVVSIWKTLMPLAAIKPTHAPVGRVQLGALLVHEGPGVAHGGDVVVVAQAAVARQTGRHALVAPVHRHQVDVDIDEQVGFGGPPIDLDFLALIGLAQMKVMPSGSSASCWSSRPCGAKASYTRSPTAWRSSASVIRRCSARAQMSTTSSTPAEAAMSSTASMTRWRLSGRCMGGRGSEMSSKAMVSRMPGKSSSGSGARSPSGRSSAWRMASSGSSSGSRGSGA